MSFKFSAPLFLCLYEDVNVWDNVPTLTTHSNKGKTLSIRDLCRNFLDIFKMTESPVFLPRAPIVWNPFAEYWDENFLLKKNRIKYLPIALEKHQIYWRREDLYKYKILRNIYVKRPKTEDLLVWTQYIKAWGKMK